MMSDSELYSSDESGFEESDDKQIVKFRKANVNDVNISDAVLESFGQHLKDEKNAHQLQRLSTMYAQYSLLVSINSWPIMPLIKYYETHFLEQELLSKGGFGSVYKAVDKLDGVTYAVKRIKFIDYMNSTSKFDRALREVKALARLDHRHVIRYFNAWLEIDEVLVTDDKLESNGDQQARFDPVKKSTKRPKIKEVREGESGNTSSLSSSPEVPPSLLSSYNLRTSMSAIDLKSTYFEDTLDSVAGEYSEECENQNQCLDLIPYNMPQHKFQRSLQTELSARFLKPTLDRTYDESVVEESFDFGHNTYEAKPVSTENHHVLSTQSRQQLVPKCVFSLFVRMQLCTKMTLQQWIEKPDRVIDLDDNLKIFKQIVLGLKHIHDMNIIHRDIKPSNIFLSHDGDFKIGDLGLAKDMTLLSYNPGSVLKNSLHTTNIGTATYAAPEQSAEKQTAYTNKVDIYSLGLILFEMFNQFASYHERAKTLNELRTFQMLPQVFETHWSAALCNLIKSMVSSKPEERLSCDEILGHPIMNRKIKASDAVLQLKEKLEEMAGENKRLLDIIKKQQEEIEVLKKLAQAGNG